MSMNPLTLIDQLIREHGSASVLKDHLSLLREQLTILQVKLSDAMERIITLQDENASLRVTNDDLKKQIDEYNQFTESHGAYFKKDGRGGYHEAVYCGICKSPTGTSGDGSRTFETMQCKCGWKSSFNLERLRRIRKSLSTSEHFGAPEESRD